MTSIKKQLPTTVPFDRFWTWLEAHPNCILRAGTPDTVLFDDEDLHWHFATEADGAHLIQLIRGKRIVGEMVVVPADIAYVQVTPQAHEGEEEWVFELVIETASNRDVPYHFVLSHGYDPQEQAKEGRWFH